MKRRWPRIAVQCLLWVSLAAGSGAYAAVSAGSLHCRPAGTGRDSFCAVAGLRLHYVDWGGVGPPIVLLAGLGSSARIFDDLAPRLTAGHRVLAVTRRGYGASAAPADGNYSNAALVADILGLMDRLGIARASFVGHSIAGGELATLGSAHADRVDRLVYLDAAYDRTQVPRLMAALPPLPAASPAVRHDLDSLARWREASLGVDLPAVHEDLQQIMMHTDAGWVPKTGAAVGEAVLGGDMAAVAHWERIPAASLAIYSSKDVADQVPPDASGAQRRAFVEYSVLRLRPWMLRAQADFIEHARCGVALEVPRSTHHLFLERPQWTARIVLAFLATPQPCHWQSQ